MEPLYTKRLDPEEEEPEAQLPEDLMPPPLPPDAFEGPGPTVIAPPPDRKSVV